MKGESMAKRQPQTIVKELRNLTYNWMDGADVPAYRAAQVAQLVDELPSFRSSPQTKNENTLRAIEALLRATLKQDMALQPVDTDKPLMRHPAEYSIDPMLLVVAICRIINTHHGVKPVAYKPILQNHLHGTVVVGQEEGEVEVVDVSPDVLWTPVMATESLQEAVEESLSKAVAGMVAEPPKAKKTSPKGKTAGSSLAKEVHTSLLPKGGKGDG